MIACALRHLGIPVSDMEKSLRFYRDWLGLTEAAHWPERSGEFLSTLVGLADVVVDIRHLVLPDGGRIELLHYHSPPSAPGTRGPSNEAGRPHIAMTVHDLHALFDTREQFGIVFKAAPVRTPDGVWVSYCHDPDGTILELVQVTP